MIYINLLFLTIIVCFIIDLSGFVNSIKQFIIKNILKLNIKPNDISIKPFDCSLCTVFWVGLIYLIITKEFSLINLCYVVGLSFFSSNISGFLDWIKDLLATIEGKLFKFLR